MYFLKELINKNKFNILLVLSVIFNVLVLLNILQSDYFGDDLYNFQTPGFIPSDYVSMTDFTIKQIVGWMSQGRLFPGCLYEFYLFDIFNTVYSYKLFSLSITIIGVVLFSYLVYIVSKDKFLSLLFLLLTPLFFQYRYYHDPMLSFHGLMQVFFIYVTLSLIFLTKYLQKSGMHYYFLSLLFFTFSLLTYEISYIFIFLYLPIVLSQMPLRKNLLKIFFLALPYILILGSLTIYVLYLRHNASIAEGPYLPNWDLVTIFITYFNQTISVIPTTYFIMYGNHSNFFQHIQIVHYVILSLFLVIYITTSFVKSANPVNKMNVSDKNLIFLGILIILLPGFLISLSPKFQSGINEIRFGLAYLPIYIQSFGASLLLALLIRKFSAIKYHIAVILLLSVVLIVHLVSNNEVIEKVNKPYKSNREILSHFFSGTFGQKLQDGTTIQFAYESPLHRKEFFNMLTRKNLNVVIAPNENYDYQVWYEINDNFAAIHTKQNSTGIEHISMYQKVDTWQEVYNDENTHFNKIALPPIFKGFYEWEGEPGIFRWAGDNANILWINNEAKPKEQTISFEMGSLIPRSMRIKLNGEELDSFTIKPGVPSPHSYTVKLVPGRNTIEFLTPEPSVKPGGLDTRNLSFSIAKFHAGQTHND